MTHEAQAFNQDIASAIVNDLNIICRFHDREPDGDFISALRARPISEWFALKMNDASFQEGARLVKAALDELPKDLGEKSLDTLCSEYAAIYLTHAYRASPYESVWIDDDHLERQGPMFAVQEWYERHGMKSADWRTRTEDHIAYELSFLAFLMQKAANGGSLQEAADFLRKHPLVWIPDFSARIVSRCREAFYAGVAILTVTYLERLKELLEDVFALDVTVVKPEDLEHKADGPRRPTCADPPMTTFVPGSAPTW